MVSPRVPLSEDATLTFETGSAATCKVYGLYCGANTLQSVSPDKEGQIVFGVTARKQFNEWVSYICTCKKG